MAQPRKVIAVRLPPPLAEKLNRLQAAFNLPPSTVVKFLLAAQLERTINEQIEIVTQQIVKPGEEQLRAKRGQNRILDVNRKGRH